MKKEKLLFLTALLAIATGCKKTDTGTSNPNTPTTPTPTPANPVTGPCSVTPEKVFFGNREIQIDTLRFKYYASPTNADNSFYSVNLISAGISGADTTVNVLWGTSTNGTEKYKIISLADFDTKRLQNAALSISMRSASGNASTQAFSVTGGSDSLTVKKVGNDYHICTVSDSTAYSGSSNKFAPISLDKKVVP